MCEYCEGWKALYGDIDPYEALLCVTSAYTD